MMDLRELLGSVQYVRCPCCGRSQRFEYNEESRVWFPVPEFCCDAMRFGDSPEWNAKLDEAIRKSMS